MSLFLNGSYECEVAITYYTPAIRAGRWYGEKNIMLQLETSRPVQFDLLYSVWKGVEGRTVQLKGRQINQVFEVCFYFDIE